MVKFVIPRQVKTAMDLQCKLLLYLDDRRILTDIKKYCDIFLEQLTEKTICKFPPLRCPLEIDVMHLLDVFPDLGDFLLREPLKLQKMCNELLYACVQSTNENSKSVEYAQVGINLKLKCIPQVYANNPSNYKGLVTFRGVLISVSKPEAYVYHSVWSCQEECEGNEVILHYIPKLPPKCYVCNSVLFENSGLRQCGERVTAAVRINDSVSKHFILLDDYIPKLKVGSSYVLHAIVLKKLTTVLGLEELVPLAAPIECPVSRDIEELYHACNGVPWKFIYCLASSLGVNVSPLNCFMHLKISLLLSLTSVKANAITGADILHVLAAGFDTRYVSEIMLEAAKLADRAVIFGTSNTLSHTALIASSGGVCLMQLPLHIYHHKQTSSVLSAIETGEINTGASKTKLKAAVWAQGMDFKKMILYNVASIFGNICRGDYGEYHDEIADFILQNAVEPTAVNKEEIKALKDVRDYINLVAGLEVVLGDVAERLLQKYFLAARKEGPRGVSVGSMAALVGNCLTSARLCRRTVANVEDAVFAIWLHASGTSEPRFAPTEYLETPADVKKLEKVINSFKEWLNQFISNYVT